VQRSGRRAAVEKNEWYVEEIKYPHKMFYAAAKLMGGEIVTKGGYWETRKEAQRMVDIYNEEERK
jgi:hypothetical protein